MRVELKVKRETIVDVEIPMCYGKSHVTLWSREPGGQRVDTESALCIAAEDIPAVIDALRGALTHLS